MDFHTRAKGLYLQCRKQPIAEREQILDIRHSKQMFNHTTTAYESSTQNKKQSVLFNFNQWTVTWEKQELIADA